MNAIRNVLQSFGRLSTREKGLIAGMIALFFSLLLFFAAMLVSASLSDLEEEVNDTRDAIRNIHALADDYRDIAHRRAEVKKLIENNPITSLRISVNNIAKRITAESGDTRYAHQGKRLSDIVSYEGKTLESRIEPKKGTKKKKKKAEGGHWEIAQQMSFDDLPLGTLYRFMEELKKTDELLFVRRLEIARRYDNLDHAKVNVSVSTVVYREAEEEE